MGTKRETTYTYEDPATKNRKQRKGVTYATPQDVPANTAPKADMSPTATPKTAKPSASVLRGKGHSRPDQAKLMAEYESLGDELTAPNRTAETIKTATARRAAILGQLERDEQGRVRIPQGVNRTEFGFDYSGAKRENVVPSDRNIVKPTPPATNRVLGADGKWHPMMDEQLHDLTVKMGIRNKGEGKTYQQQIVDKVTGPFKDPEFRADLLRRFGLSGEPPTERSDIPAVAAVQNLMYGESPNALRALDRATRDAASYVKETAGPFLSRVDDALGTYADTGEFKMPPAGGSAPNSPLDLSGIDVTANQNAYDILRRAQAGEAIAPAEQGVVQQLRDQGFLNTESTAGSTPRTAGSTPRTAGSNTTIYKNEDGSYSDTPLNAKSTVWKPSNNQAMDSSGVMPASQNLLRNTPSLPGRSYTSGGRGTGEPFMINRTGPDLRGMSNGMINQLANAKRAEIASAQQRRRMAGGAATGGNLMSQVSRLYDQAQKTEANALRKGMDVYAAKSLGDGLRGQADALLEAQKDSTTRRGQDMTYEVGMRGQDMEMMSDQMAQDADVSEAQREQVDNYLTDMASFINKDGDVVKDPQTAFHAVSLMGVNPYSLKWNDLTRLTPSIKRMVQLSQNYRELTGRSLDDLSQLGSGNPRKDIDWFDIGSGNIGFTDKFAEILDVFTSNNVEMIKLPGVGNVRYDLLMRNVYPSSEEYSSLSRKVD